MHPKVAAFCAEQRQLGEYLKRRLKADAFDVSFYELVPVRPFVLPTEMYFDDFTHCIGRNLLIPESFHKFIPSSSVLMQEKRTKRRIAVHISLWFEEGIPVELGQRLGRKLEKKLKTDVEIAYHVAFDDIICGMTIMFNKNPAKIYE